LTLKAFFEYMYKVWNISNSFKDFLKTFVFNLFIKRFSFFLHQEIFTFGDVVVKLYYEEFPNIQNRSPLKLQEWMERAM
jgi:hypothetical protein